jgi:hypothetical protein
MPIYFTEAPLALDDESMHASKLVVNSVCVLTYVVLAVIVFWPASPWNSSRLPSTPFGSSPVPSTPFAGYGFGDPAQMTWFLAWVPYALKHGLNLFHTNFIDYPSGVDLANGTSSPILGLLAAPATLTLGPVAAFNLLLRLAFMSSASSMFLVMRRWCRWPAAFIGGLFYGFGPYMVSQAQTHLNLVFVPIPPLIVWCIYELLYAKRHNAILIGTLLGALAGVQALIEPELLALLSLVILIGLIGLALRRLTILRMQFGGLALAAIPAAATFLCIAGYMIWSMRFGQGHLVGTAQPVSSLQLTQGDLLGPIIPTVNELVAPAPLATKAATYVAGNFSENSTYISLPLVILLIGFTMRRRRVKEVFIPALLALVAYVLSLGPTLLINGRSTGIPMPEQILSHIVVLDNLIPVRFSFVASLFVAITIAIGVDRFARDMTFSTSISYRERIMRFIGVALIIASVALLVPKVPFTTKSPTWPPDTNSALRVIPTGSVVLNYPLPVFPFTEAMSWQAAQQMRFRLMGGYATVQAGINHGGGNPPLLAQPFIQEYLMDAQYSNEYYYPMPNSAIDPKRALCSFLSFYGVGAVVFWNVGNRPARVKSLFESVLGGPARVSKNGNLVVWLAGHRHCS